MNHLEIEQSSVTHPGHLTDEDLAVLRSPGMPPIRLRFGPTDLTRRDAGSLLIVIEWLGGLAVGGAIGAFGKDIYEWVKSRTKGVMQKKIEDTRAAQSPYPFRDPVWEIKIDMSDRERSLSITLKATSPDGIERAAALLATRLDDPLLALKQNTIWRFNQTLDDVEFHEVVW